MGREMWRCGDVEMWRCGDVEMWRCGGVEMWNESILLRISPINMSTPRISPRAKLLVLGLEGRPR
jgi:hypothetical protein